MLMAFPSGSQCRVTGGRRPALKADSRPGSGLNIASFAEDTDGELFMIDVRESGIYKLVPGP